MLLKIVGGIVLIISLITGVWAVDDRYAKGEELKKTETKFSDKVKNTEVQLVQTLERFKSDIAQERLEQRYINLTDQTYQYKALIRRDPKNKEIRDDYEAIEKERQRVKDILDNRRLQLKEQK